MILSVLHLRASERFYHGVLGSLCEECICGEGDPSGLCMY